MPDLLLTLSLGFAGFVLCALAFATGWHFGWWRGQKRGVADALAHLDKTIAEIDRQVEAVKPRTSPAANDRFARTVPTPGAWPRARRFTR